MNATKYLIEIQGVLYGYQTPIIARIDIAAARNAGEKIGQLYELKNGWTLQYWPVSEEVLSDVHDVATAF